MDELGFNRTQRQLGCGLERHRTAELGRRRAAPRRRTHEVARVGEQDLWARQLRVLAFAEDAEISRLSRHAAGEVTGRSRTP